MTPSAQDRTQNDFRSEFARRIREIRLISHGPHGVPMLAGELGLPPRTWQNYEAGVIMPALVLLKFLQATDASPAWLLSGDGPKYSRIEHATVDEMTSNVCACGNKSHEEDHARCPSTWARA